MIASRATAAAINHSGTSFMYASVMKTVTSNNLSAAGSSTAPSSLCQPKRLARKPSAASDSAAAPNRRMVVTNCRSASATAMGATSRILIALMTFGIWRGDQDTRLAAQLKAQNPIVAGGDRLQTSVQRKRALQRFGSAARRQTKSDRIAR